MKKLTFLRVVQLKSRVLRPRSKSNGFVSENKKYNKKNGKSYTENGLFEVVRNRLCSLYDRQADESQPSCYMPYNSQAHVKEGIFLFIFAIQTRQDYPPRQPAPKRIRDAPQRGCAGKNQNYCYDFFFSQVTARGLYVTGVSHGSLDETVLGPKYLPVVNHLPNTDGSFWPSDFFFILCLSDVQTTPGHIGYLRF